MNGGVSSNHESMDSDGQKYLK